MSFYINTLHNNVSFSCNSVTVLVRFTAHGDALRAILHAGVSCGHHGNTAACHHVDKVYDIPCLLSGLGPFVLTKPELFTHNDNI